VTLLSPAPRARTLAASALVSLASLLLAVPAPAQTPAGTDLAIAMVDAPDPVAPGKVLTYRISVSAKGQRAGSNVSLRTSVPAGTTFEAFTGPTSGWTLAAPNAGGMGEATAMTATLAPGRAAVFQFSVRVAADAPEGSVISSSATVSSPMTDVNPTDNSAATTTTVRPRRVPTADVTISADYLQEPAPNLGQLVEMIVVKNDGPQTATDVRVRTPVPMGTLFVTADSSEGTITSPAVGESGDIVCDVGALGDGHIVVLTIVVRVTAPVGAHVETLAGVTTSSTDPDVRDNTAHASARVIGPGPVADVTAGFVDPPERVFTNADVSYTITARNDGPALAEDVIAVIPVPRGTRFISAEATAGTLRTPPRGRRGAIGWRPGSLEPGASASVTITVRVGGRAGVPVVATAITASRATDTDLMNNAAGATTRVQTLGDAVIQWDPPDVGGEDPRPEPTNVVVDPSASGAGKTDASTSVARADGDPPVCYNIYVSSSPNVEPTAENLWTTVPANQTTTTAPVAPGGSFFTVTAEYDDGESATPEPDGAGDQPGASLSSMKVASSKITAKGSGFTDTVEVLLDGIPFADAAKVKSANAKAVQKGSLAVGLTVDEYMATGTEFLIIVRNSDGGVSIWEYQK
jgi:uncharacterized repeat protein (TIGR01451 family)